MDISEIKNKIRQAEEISKDVDQELRLAAFENVLKFLLWSNEKIQQSTRDNIDQTDTKDPVRTVFLPELISNINPKSYTDRAIITSYYLFKHEKIDTFNANQIGEQFAKARVPKPSNMTDTLNSLIKRGFLREGSPVDGKKGFEITQKGIEYVEIS